MAEGEFKVTMFINTGKWGWSETLYTEQSSMDDAEEETRLLVEKRGALLLPHNAFTFPGFEIPAVRITELTNPPKSRIIHNPDWQGFQDEKAVTDEWDYRDMPFMALNIAAYAGNDYQRTIQMRGLPEAAITNKLKNKDELGKWGEKLEEYKDYLILSSWGMRVSQRAPANPLYKVDVATLNGALVTLTAPGHTIAVDDKIKIVGLPKNHPLKGLQKVWHIDGADIQIINADVTELTYGGGWEVQKDVKEVIGFTRLENVRASKRDTGRPFGSPVGRQKNRCDNA